MSNYTEKDVIHLAKRFNNKKRNFLLVNPLQGKHIPVSPNKSLEMVKVLSRRVAEKYPETKLVIGFAETATAIGFMVAKDLGKECNYITTTRENLGDNPYFEFKEEHSHAVDQRLYSSKLEQFISITDEIILVDDELTTGKTVLNFVNQLKILYPQISLKKIIAVSIINRINDENSKLLESEGIVCEYLVKPENADYEIIVEEFDIQPQQDCKNDKEVNKESIEVVEVSKFNNHMIMGVNCEAYSKECEDIAFEALNILTKNLNKTDEVLVLGTEEFMYPAIVLGKLIEDKELVTSVKFHATTRSPIGVCKKENYPIKNGFKLNSFYEENRPTYVYNLDKYDKVIVYTDSNSKLAREKAIKDLSNIISTFGLEKLIFIEGGFNV